MSQEATVQEAAQKRLDNARIVLRGVSRRGSQKAIVAALEEVRAAEKALQEKVH